MGCPVESDLLPYPCMKVFFCNLRASAALPRAPLRMWCGRLTAVCDRVRLPMVAAATEEGETSPSELAAIAQGAHPQSAKEDKKAHKEVCS